MKFFVQRLVALLRWSPPLAGAWIEMPETVKKYRRQAVAPLAGAWIEISLPLNLQVICKSPPSRGRGLKCMQQRGRDANFASRPPRGGRGLK